MFRRLDRYVLGELLRVGIITAVVLVTVIAFGAAIKPLANDQLLAPQQVLKYIVLAIVPMLQFALPFAAGFAGTMGFYRLTTENEVLATAVAGVSYKRLLAPVMALGIVLTLVMIVLTQWVIPRFWHVLEQSIARDMTVLFQTAIKRGETFEMGRRQIYADRVIIEENPEDSAADTRLRLIRVAAAEINEETGMLDRDMTAAEAHVDIYRRPEATYIKFVMGDAVAYDPDRGVLAWAERLESRTIVIPNRVEDDAVYFTLPELLALYDDPDDYGSVVQRRVQLAEAVRDHVLFRSMKHALQTDGGVDMRTATSTFRVETRDMSGGEFAPLEGDRVRIVQMDPAGAGVVREFLATRAALERRASEPMAPLIYDLILTDCLVVDHVRKGDNLRRELRLEGIRIVGHDAAPVADATSESLIALAAPLRRDGNRVDRFVRVLEEKIVLVRYEALARLTKRFALSLTAFLLLVLGSVFAMAKRDSLPLTIYLWAFVPSVLDLVMISAGEHMVRDGHLLTGFGVMWGGNLILVALLLQAYRTLTRN